MVQVGGGTLPGYGGTGARPPGWEDSPWDNYPGKPEGNGNGGNGNGGGPGAFDPRGAFQVPNNFWGFVILMMGLKS